MRAFCYASGLIEFGDQLPDGAFPIASGPPETLRNFISAKAGDLLVPGIPEADCALARVDALIGFRKAINDRAPAGVIVLSERLRELLS
jgi:hypothetical protein